MIKGSWYGLALAALGLGALCGCASLSTLDRARTLQKGQVRVTPAVAAAQTLSSGGSGVTPRFEVGLGYGAEDDVEVFGKLWGSGLSGGTKMQLVRSDSANSGVDVAVAPSVGWHFSDKLTFDLPLLAGINLGGGHQLVLSLRPAYAAWLDPGGIGRPVSYVFLGGSLGTWTRITESLAFLPEIAWTGNLFAEEGFGTPIGSGAGLQISLGLAIIR